MSKPNRKSGSQTVFWWITWIVLTIVSFFAAAAVWTPLISRHFGSIHENKNAILWVGAVFGSWMVILVPLIIVMYQKVDKAYDDARIRREKAAARFRSIFVEKSKRLIPPEISKKLASIPETVKGGHLVNATLKDGRHIPSVFISGGSEILGIYDASEMTFEGSDVAAAEIADMSHPPRFSVPQWLRLDGVAPSE
ncbi:MAG TPA: hypothetical protein VD913_06355 [bacterium]|nr:hypothetical protein [bacterium]